MLMSRVSTLNTNLQKKYSAVSHVLPAIANFGFNFNETRRKPLQVPVVLYGWDMSYFSVKVELYFKYKQIPFEKKRISLWDFNSIQNNVGAKVMPVVKIKSNLYSDYCNYSVHIHLDKWLQDSRNIIDTFEDIFMSNKKVFPLTPIKLFLSNLIEMWGDEFWIPPAMYYRWNFAENEEFFRKEAGECLMPLMPSFIQNYASNIPVNTLNEFLPVVGVVPSQHKALEDWTKTLLDLLETHFAKYDFIMGDKYPTIGDFGLVGPLIPHLGRDLYPKNNLLNENSYPNICKWMNRMKNPLRYDHVYCNSNDKIPSTLNPILSHIFSEFIPMINNSIEHLQKLKTIPKFYKCDDNGKNIVNKTLPRRLDEIQYPLYTHKTVYTYKRNVIPFNLYKMQIVLDSYKRMEHCDKQTVINYLDSFDGFENLSKQVLEMDIPRLNRENVRVKFA